MILGAIDSRWSLPASRMSHLSSFLVGATIVKLAAREDFTDEERSSTMKSTVIFLLDVKDS